MKKVWSLVPLKVQTLVKKGPSLVKKVRSLVPFEAPFWEIAAPFIYRRRVPLLAGWLVLLCCFGVAATHTTAGAELGLFGKDHNINRMIHVRTFAFDVNPTLINIDIDVLSTGNVGLLTQDLARAISSSTVTPRGPPQPQLPPLGAPRIPPRPPATPPGPCSLQPHP